MLLGEVDGAEDGGEGVLDGAFGFLADDVGLIGHLEQVLKYAFFLHLFPLNS